MNKIDVFGDVMLDVYNFGDAKRISPEGPHLVYNDLTTKNELGGAGHVVRLLKNFGFQPKLHSAVARDEAGKTVTAFLEEHKIDFDLELQNKTTVKSRYIVSGQTILRVDTDGQFTGELKVDSDVSSRCLVSDYNKGTVTRKLIEELIHHKKKVYVDVKKNDPSFYKGTYLIKPNQKEFDNFLVDGATEFEKVRRLICDFNIQNIWITRGERGSTLYYEQNECICRQDFDVEKAEVRDVTGAGDVMIASFIYAEAKGYSTIQSCRFAHLAAANAISKIGTSPISHNEIEQFICKLNLSQIVFTNGCFDLLHFGHLELLRFCKSLGGKVVVGLNSDESVSRLKGAKRPINNQEFRKYILEQLSYVDEVIVFDEDEPTRLIQELKPKVLVKGADYRVDQIAGADFVIKNGGRVELFEFIEGYSTTNIVKKINDK
jgi:D-beta-D-heptose 7-phosphate kinase/D-beta-D-heptose 1-phosphate adenosyltransferase